MLRMVCLPVLQRLSNGGTEMTMPIVDFWFDFASSYSYPAAMRADALAAKSGVAIRYRPFLLGPIFKAQGWDTSPFNIYEAKGRYMWRDLERLCADLGIPFQRPSPFPQNSLLAARVALGRRRRELARRILPRRVSRAIRRRPADRRSGGDRRNSERRSARRNGCDLRAGAVRSDQAQAACADRGSRAGLGFSARRASSLSRW